VRLICESGLQGDRGEGEIRFGQLAGGSLDAELSHILPHGAAVKLPELSGEVNGVDSDPARDLAEPYGLLKMSVKHFLRAIEPSRSGPAPLGPLPLDQRRTKFQHQPLDRQGTGKSSQGMFPVKPQCEPGDLRVLRAQGFPRQGAVTADMLQPVIRYLGYQAVQPISSGAIGVDFAGGPIKQLMPAQVETSGIELLFAASREYKTNAGPIVGMIGNDEPGAMPAGEYPRIREVLNIENLAVVGWGGRRGLHGAPAEANIEPSFASTSVPK